MTNYRKSMMEALAEVRLDEAKMSPSQVAALKKAYEPMRGKKISMANANKLRAMMDKFGKDKDTLIQLFKADIPFISQSAVTQLISKHGMKGAEINKLREEFNVESVDIDEGKVTKKERDRLEDENQHGELALKLAQAYGTPEEVKKVKEINKRHEKRGSIERKDQQERDKISNKYYKMAEEVELDEVVKVGDNVHLGFGAKGGAGFKGKIIKIDGKNVHIKNPKGKEYKGPMKFVTSMEEVELDEAKYDLYHKDFSSAMQHAYKMAKKLHGITVDPKEIDDKVASGPRKPSEGKTNSYRLKGDKGAIQVQVYNKGGSKPYELNMYKEEVEIDEKKQTAQYIDRGQEKITVTVDNMRNTDIDTVITKNLKPKWKKVGGKKSEYDRARAALAKSMEEVELDEGKMKELHAYISQGKSAEEIAKIMKLDVDTIKALMAGYHEAKRDVDPADVDTSATDDDVKSADKNIMMQLRKSVSLRGRFDVEFLDKTKEKVDQKIAQAVLDKYGKMRKPADKEKFQAKVSKSHKDLLTALKEERTEMKKKYLDTKQNSLEDSILGVWKQAVEDQEDRVQDRTKLEAAQLRRENQKKNVDEEVEIDEVSNRLVLEGLFGKSNDKKAAKKKVSAQIKDIISREKAAIKRLRKLGVKEATGDKEAYQKFFNKALKKFGVKSPSELKGDKEKEFYDYVDKNWKADHEESVKKESYEIGTDEYRDHTIEVTPGQSMTWGDMHRFKQQSMREALKKVWNTEEDKSESKKNKVSEKKKTVTGKEADLIVLNPSTGKK